MCSPTTATPHSSVAVGELATALLLLPSELLKLIFSGPTLSQADRKKLRLVCRRESVACPALFHRIPLSCLTRDRDAFLHIAAEPRLACHVREIAWLSMNCRPERAIERVFRFLHGPKGDASLYQGIEEAPELKRLEKLLPWARDELCWVPSPPDKEAIEADGDLAWSCHEAVLADFGPRFAKAAGSMDGLRSIVCQYMPAESVVARLPSTAGEYGGYPITAALLEAQSGEVLTQPEYDVFSRVLLPHVADKESSVRELSYHERFGSLPMHRLFRDYSSAPRLTRITLVLEFMPGLRPEREPLCLGSLAFAGQFLRTATALQVLNITFTGPVGPKSYSRRMKDKGWDLYNDRVEAYYFDDHDITPEVEVPSFDEEYGPLGYYDDLTNDEETREWARKAAEALLGHAYGAEETPAWSRLRSLSLTQVPIDTDDLVVLVERHANTLSQLRLGEYELDFWLIQNMASISNLRLSSIQIFCTGIKPQCTETFLLRYLRNEFESSRISNYDGFITTHTRVWDDGEGGPEDDASSECTWDRFPGEKGKIPKPYYLDDFTGEVVYYPELDAEHSHASDADADDASDASSVDSQDARVATAPRWKLGRFFASPHSESNQDSIWCWPVPREERDGHRTRVWEFVHRSGQRAYGTEPLTFFEDWDSAVDVAIPRPDSEALSEFIDCTEKARCPDCDHNRGRCVRSLLGSTVELLWHLAPPAGAVQMKMVEKEKFERRRRRTEVAGLVLPSDGPCIILRHAYIPQGV